MNFINSLAKYNFSNCRRLRRDPNAVSEAIIETFLDDPLDCLQFNTLLRGRSLESYWIYRQVNFVCTETTNQI